MRYLTTLALGLILGGAITLTFVELTKESPELAFTELFYQGAMAYLLAPDSGMPKDEPFTGPALQYYESGQLKRKLPRLSDR